MSGESVRKYANKMTFGERIKIIRGSLSQEDFGYLFGVRRTTVLAWE